MKFLQNKIINHNNYLQIPYMKKFCLLFIGLLVFSDSAAAQTKTKSSASTIAYEIKVNIKNLKDPECILTKYTWEKSYIVDTAKVDKNGNMVFKGNTPLEKGIYSIYSPKKQMMYFDLIINSSQKFSIETDTIDFYKNMKITGPKEQSDFIDFVIFMGSKNLDRSNFEKDIKARKDPDSTKLMTEKNTQLFNEIKKYQLDYLSTNPDNYLSTIIRLQMDPEVPEGPKIKRNRQDSSFQYDYFKAHFWDGIPLNDIGIINTNRLFSERLKRYYEKVILQNPDTMIKEADWLIGKTMPNKDNFRFVTHHLTYWTETSKIMGTDAVFVHIIKKYYKTGQATWLDDKQLSKVTERADILEPLLIGKIVPDLELIDTAGIKTIQKLGMDTVNSSEKLTKLYYDNIGNLQKLFVNLKKIKADYTVLLFWDVDCGHCKKEVPIILETYHKLKSEGINVEVFAVYTQHEYDKWKKFVKENKLDWINVADGVHLHNLKKKFDIFSTPVIYLLDKDKKIKAKRIGAEQIEEVIRAFMKMEKK